MALPNQKEGETQKITSHGRCRIQQSAMLFCRRHSNCSPRLSEIETSQHHWSVWSDQGEGPGLLHATLLHPISTNGSVLAVFAATRITFYGKQAWYLIFPSGSILGLSTLVYSWVWWQPCLGFEKLSQRWIPDGDADLPETVEATVWLI